MWDGWDEVKVSCDFILVKIFMFGVRMFVVGV